MPAQGVHIQTCEASPSASGARYRFEGWAGCAGAQHKGRWFGAVSACGCALITQPRHQTIPVFVATSIVIRYGYFTFTSSKRGLMNQRQRRSRHYKAVGVWGWRQGGGAGVWSTVGTAREGRDGGDGRCAWTFCVICMIVLPLRSVCMNVKLQTTGVTHPSHGGGAQGVQRSPTSRPRRGPVKVLALGSDGAHTCIRRCPAATHGGFITVAGASRVSSTPAVHGCLSSLARSGGQRRVLARHRPWHRHCLNSCNSTAPWR